MYYYLAGMCFLLFASFCINVYFFFFKKPKKTYDESEILADILRGNALVRIERIAPEAVFLRRP